MRFGTTVADLGTPSKDGELGVIHAGIWPDRSHVQLRWNKNLGKWVGNPIPIVNSIDQIFMFSTEPNWSYVSGTEGGPAGGNAIRCVDRLKEFFAAGLRLQDRHQYRGRTTLAGFPFKVTPWFYEFDDEDFVVFANDIGAIEWPTGSGVIVDGPPSGTMRPSDHSITFQAESLTTAHLYATQLGHGTVIQTDDSGQPRIFGAGWTDVVLKQPLPDGTEGTINATPAKRFLYATVYGYTGSRAADGGLAAQSYEMRWVGTAS